jgi:two-component sensor histidine kinase
MNLPILLILLNLTLNVFSQDNSPLEIEKRRYANSLLQSAIAEKDTLQLAEAYYLLGKIEASKLNILQSNKLFLKSLKIQEQGNDNYKIGRLYLRLFENEFEQNHTEDARKYIQKAMVYFKRLNSPKELKACYTALGQIFVGNGKMTTGIIKSNLDSALYYFGKAEILSLLENDELEIARIRLQIGAIYIQLKDKRAIEYLEKSLLTHKKYQQQGPLIQCMLAMVNAYIANNQLDKGFEMIQEVEQKKANGYSFTKDNIMTLEGCYSSYYQMKGDWRQAFTHYYQLKEYQEKSILSDREGAVSDLNIAYETSKKEKQIAEQKREIELQDEIVSLQKRFLWLVLSLLILTIAVGYVFFRLYRKNQDLNNRNAILLQEQNHRVKNNLQVISSLLNLQANLLEDEKAKQAVDESQLRIEAITILHRQLYDNPKTLDKIDMEIFITDLTEIILQTYGLTNVEVDYNITFRELSTDKTIFIGLLINELLTNACKYSLKDNDEPLLQISFFEKANNIILKVKDNGRDRILFTENTLELEQKKQSFGIKLINMMVLQLNGTIEYQYDNGSEFTLKFREF